MWAISAFGLDTDLNVQRVYIHASLASIVTLRIISKVFAVPHSELLTTWHSQGYGEVVEGQLSWIGTYARKLVSPHVLILRENNCIAVIGEYRN